MVIRRGLHDNGYDDKTDHFQAQEYYGYAKCKYRCHSCGGYEHGVRRYDDHKHSGQEGYGGRGAMAVVCMGAAEVIPTTAAEAMVTSARAMVAVIRPRGLMAIRKP